MRKYYILDTNVLLHDPDSLLSFQDNDVIVPIFVIEEVDHFKRQQSELGHNARRVSRLLDTYRRRGNLSEGVQTEAGGTLRVAIDAADAGRDAGSLNQVTAGGNFVDNSLLHLARDLSTRSQGKPVVLVTKDTNLRIKADALGIHSEDYETGQVDVAQLYEGHRDLGVDAETLQRLAAGEPVQVQPREELVPNEYVRVRQDGGSRSVLGRYEATVGRVVPLRPDVTQVPGVTPRNMEQHFALDALLDDSISLVTLLGKAGTGKTLLALAAGLHKVKRGDYTRLLVARPIQPLGRDLGYLPGALEDKLHPWMRPIFDNLELLTDPDTPPNGGPSAMIRKLIERDVLAVEPLAYIRGRSIPHQFLLVDEAQNLTPLEAKAIVTRAGEGTKLVFTGDPYQIDNPYIDSASSGFNTLVHAFRPEPMGAHVHLTKGERSALAERASNIL